METLLNELVQKLTAAYGDRLLSVVLFGSAAAGDYQGSWSDLNILCVLRQVRRNELQESEPIVRWWREKGNPSPVMLSEQEVSTSTDVFPLEFRDMLDSRKVLHGADPLVGVSIDDLHYRILVEHELRAKLLRLRQKAAGVLSDHDLTIRLLADSLSTFCVLARHALRLHGEPAPATKRATIELAAERFGIGGRAFYTLLDLRDGAVKPKSLDAPALFEDYLKEIEALVNAVDRLMSQREPL